MVQNSSCVEGHSWPAAPSRKESRTHFTRGESELTINIIYYKQVFNSHVEHSQENEGYVVDIYIAIDWDIFML